ncbi:Diacylglycerol O-acyltransferase 2-like protein 6 [Fukomys damarensis]|uniref:Diacylglycerol O-acyltransferase 2-like protein 6 n=1 Tax=Fukomys damarensis TaxID=885580 RepID=A0A091DFM7_FUKDA|nr:Diacylglycerol O-acyltransferase 2-like protein 6 [Fukomys damarensis]
MDGQMGRQMESNLSLSSKPRSASLTIIIFGKPLVKTHDLSPKHNYIIANHLHGVFSYGAFINFATEATGFARIFPSITPFTATLDGVFWIPLVRDYVMSMGMCPVSKLALEYTLNQKDSGNAVVIMVGGASESLLYCPGSSTILLKHRKGFIKLALETGRSITTVVGEPLPIPKIKRANKETVDKYHALYISALRKLFDQHKVEYGLSENQELTII